MGVKCFVRFLPSVVRYSKTEGAKIYVADNGSTDASVDMLRQEFPDVHLIILKENLGFAEGYNLALQQVSAEYVMLLNSDVEVTEHWLVPLVATWTLILKLRHASLKSGVGGKRNCSNMQERPADL